jgi:hypothetical protein
MNARHLIIILCVMLFLGTMLAHSQEARAENYGIGAKSLGALALIEGQPRFFQSEQIGSKKIDEDRYKKYPHKYPDVNWGISRTPRGFTIWQDAKEGGRLYLSYDPEAPKKGVFLTKEAGPGSVWTLRLPNGSDIEQEIRAVGLGDWYLDGSGEEEQYLDTHVTRKIFTLRKLKLTKGEGPKFEVNHAGK